MAPTIRQVAINIGGSDAPGVNAVIHGAVYVSRGLGWQIFGIRGGYDGFLEPQKYPDGGLVELRRSTVLKSSHGWRDPGHKQPRQEARIHPSDAARGFDHGL